MFEQLIRAWYPVAAFSIDIVACMECIWVDEYII
jgi:hypothetical protein